MIKICKKFECTSDAGRLAQLAGLFDKHCGTADLFDTDCNETINLYDKLCDETADLYNNLLFFDIETTGFSAKHTVCYLIGCTFYKADGWNFMQWFLDKPSEEADLIKEFVSFAGEYKYLIHFNGEGFDLPYLAERCSILGIDEDFDNFRNNIISVDIFKAVKSVKELLKLDNYRLKTLEQFLGIAREDIYSGGDLVKVYKDYVRQPDKNALDTLLLHNYDDITALPSLMPLLSYCTAAMYDKTSITYSVNAAIDYSGAPLSELIISMVLPVSVPIPVSYGKEPFYIKISGSTMKLRIRMYTGELKYYYPNYRDYYYLPDEDKALHKSVAAFVDQNHREQAKAENCYMKKSGTFLPQMSELEMPRFKINYNDKYSFFEAADKFLQSKERLSAYADHIIRFALPHI